MAVFHARICFGSDFAEKNLSLAGNYFSRLAPHFPAGCGVTSKFERYTCVVCSISAPTADTAKRILTNAWNEAFPGTSDEVKMLVTPDDGADVGKLMRSIYCNYYGVDEYQELTTEFAQTIPVLREKGALEAFRMQSYLFVIDDGCGFTTLLSSFGDYLRRMGVYEGDDNRRMYTEYIVGKETEGGRISVNDLIDAVFESDKNPDNNIYGIDISCFLEGSQLDELRRFVRRLYRFQNRYVFVFRIPFIEKRALDDVVAALSDVALLRTVQIPPLSNAVQMEHLWDRAGALGFRVNADSLEEYCRLAAREKKDGRFYGYKTVDKIIEREVLRKAEKCARDKEEGKTTDTTLFKKEEAEKEKPEKTGYDALSELIGMEKITERVREIAAQVRISVNNEKLDHPCIHMRFLGAPGTGKTTVARIIGQIFREEGILRKGGFFEYSARQLCAEYVGQTAVRTASICRDAYGSVLFIDEAYALYDDDHQTNDYGKEALTTLISEMENHRDDMLVIMAGYTDDMETLMKGNAGLRSRMPYAITFPNYTREQLFEIFMLMVRKHFEYTPELEKKAKDYFSALSDEYLSSKEFANARFVRNLYERTWSKAALRASLSGQTAITLTGEDFLAASGEKEFSEKLTRKNAKIGF